MNDDNQPTHVVIPMQLYKQLGQFLTSLPYSQVAKIIPAVEENSIAVFENEAGLFVPDLAEPVSGDSEDE